MKRDADIAARFFGFIFFSISVYSGSWSFSPILFCPPISQYAYLFLHGSCPWVWSFSIVLIIWLPCLVFLFGPATFLLVLLSWSGLPHLCCLIPYSLSYSSLLYLSLVRELVRSFCVGWFGYYRWCLSSCPFHLAFRCSTYSPSLHPLTVVPPCPPLLPVVVFLILN